MPTAERRATRGCARLLAGVLAIANCHPSNAAFPWSAQAAEATVDHAEVRTVNTDYVRRTSHVLVREVDRPTRAALDFAAYHANFMITELAPETAPAAASPVVTEQPFAGLIERASLTADLEQTPLDAAQRRHPLAFAPLVEYLLTHKIAGAQALEELGSAVRSESWGQPPTPGVATQAIAEAFVRTQANGSYELWVKIEFAPWFELLGELPDQDRDGFPEVYGRARSDRLRPEIIAAITTDYAGHVFDAGQVRAWANELSSYWYPSFNTDLVPAGETWPDANTEPQITRELHGRTFAAPAIVLRGKPQGTPTYQVFLVHGLAATPQVAGATRAAGTATALELARTEPTPDHERVVAAVRAELAAHGQGSVAAWDAELARFHAAVRGRLASAPKAIKALPGENGFLFYRNSLEYAVGGDLEQQPAGKNPLPIILEFKQQLAALGVDFLFVPVPAKVEVFPDQLAPKLDAFVGQVVVPWSRKFLLRLAEHGIESVDLLAPFLRARAAADGDGQEPLYQRQDTHWSHRGLELAAQILGERVKRYPWYRELARHGQTFTTQPTTFTRYGDLHSRLPEAQKKKYQPETLNALRVLRADGSAYEDDPESPIVVLGDSFTGVYELTDAEHAGLSAHLARHVGYPIDLVMSYGGGPNVRNKLMRRGTAELAKKKLVIWVMAARDLYHYWEDWEPLKP